jgi:hypothetical protein
MKRVLVLAALLCALIPPAHAHAGKHMEVALEDDSVFYWRAYYSRTKAFKQAAQLRVTHIRLNLIWSSLVNKPRTRRVPKRIHYNFARVDSLVRAARKRGVKVQISLTGPAPAWASRSHHSGPLWPIAWRYGRFVRAAARHFKGRVKRYSIWNEPNHINWLAPKRAQASMYRRLYRRGYREIKRVDRHAQVLIGETAPYASKPYRAAPPLLFLRKLTCVDRRYKPIRRCPKLYADGYAHHPYEYKRSPRRRFRGRDNVTMSGLHKLVHALNRLAAHKRLRTPHSKRRLNIYLTEFGYFARGKYRIAEKKRARYLRLAFESARRNPRVKEMLQYVLVRTDHFHRDFDMSIVDRHRTKRSFRTLRAWAAKMARRHKIAVPHKPRHKPRH